MAEKTAQTQQTQQQCKQKREKYSTAAPFCMHTRSVL